jgi:molybdopterin converting factor subunit 1
MNKIKLLFFATLRDRAGTRSAEIEIPDGMTVGVLKGRIAELYPGLVQSVETALIAINREYADVNAVVPDGAEVALFPPVSGGNHAQDPS